MMVGLCHPTKIPCVGIEPATNEVLTDRHHHPLHHRLVYLLCYLLSLDSRALSDWDAVMLCAKAWVRISEYSIFHFPFFPFPPFLTPATRHPPLLSIYLLAVGTLFTYSTILPYSRPGHPTSQYLRACLGIRVNDYYLLKLHDYQMSLPAFPA